MRKVMHCLLIAGVVALLAYAVYATVRNWQLQARLRVIEARMSAAAPIEVEKEAGDQNGPNLRPTALKADNHSNQAVDRLFKERKIGPVRQFLPSKGGFTEFGLSRQAPLLDAPGPGYWQQRMPLQRNDAGPESRTK
jgi:hypothetical protein